MKRMGLLNRLDRCARWALLLGLVLAFPPVARASISFNNRQAGFGAGTTLTVNNAYGAQGPTQDFPVPVGGMGEVYKARDTRLDRTVAIKMLPGDFAADPERARRFEREARTISRLNHPHICALYDLGQYDGSSFLVMEYLEGESLAERLSKGPLSLEEALRYATQIAEALAEAHQQGIVHRDLKPANVVLTKKGAKLLDFGIAKLRAGAVSEEAATATASELAGEGVIVGTPQ